MEFLADLHPKIVHFPIAFFTLYIIVELIYFATKNLFANKLAAILLVIGVITGIGAVLTGNMASKEVLDTYKYVLEEHESWASMTQWYFTLLLVFRFFLIFKNEFTGYKKSFFLFLVIFGLLMIFKTGEYGGKLVYKYGVGTEMIEHKSIDE